MIVTQDVIFNPRVHKNRLSIFLSSRKNPSRVSVLRSRNSKRISLKAVRKSLRRPSIW